MSTLEEKIIHNSFIVIYTNNTADLSMEESGQLARRIYESISPLLASQRKELEEKYKRLTKDLTKYDTDFTCHCGQEHRMSFLIKKPKSMKGEIIELKVNGKALLEEKV